MSRSVTVLLISLLLLPTACSNPIEDEDNVLVKPKAQGACADVLVEGGWYRYDSLLIEDIGGASPGLVEQLNGLWASDILKQELNLIFTVESFDGDTVHLRFVNGARVGTGDDQRVCLLEDTEVSLTMPASEGGIGPSSETFLTVFSGTVESPKNCAAPSSLTNDIPVSRVVLNSSCDAASGLIQGTISGAISQAALDVTCTCLVLGPELSDEACGVLSTEGTGSDACAGCVGEMPDGTSKPFVSLNAIMPALNGGQPLLFECEDDQGGPAACLTATFDASRLPEKPEPCL